ncbi:MAG: hypothetical protein HQM12_20210 [SAR324 cluster bacterium]|nr:hypothetical protein [SAR324 cluster bacterium]
MNINQYIKKAYLSGLVIFISLLILKLIFGISEKSFPIDFDYLFSPDLFFKCLLWLSLSYIFYQIGAQCKKTLNLHNVSTGIVVFISMTFLINIILAIFDVSSVFNETLLMYLTLIILLVLNFWQIQSSRKQRLLYSLSIFSCFIILAILPESTFIGDPTIDIIDVKGFWYPMTKTYFEHGLSGAMTTSTNPGYGLYTHHVWTLLKRLTMLNQLSLPSYHYMSNLLFFLAVLFIYEIRTSRITSIFLLLFFSLYILLQGWVSFLLVNSLMGEGVTSLFFAIIVNELLQQKSKFNAMALSEINRNFIFFWITAGILFITKPFVSHMVFLLPFIMFSNSWIKDYKKTAILFPSFFFLSFGVISWHVVVSHLQHVDKVTGYQVTLSSLQLEALIPVFQHWFSDKLTMGFMVVWSIGIIIGFNKKNSEHILISVCLILINLLLVLWLYATLWADYSDKDSAFRYFLETYYLMFIALGRALDGIFANIGYAFWPIKKVNIFPSTHDPSVH